MPSLAVMALLTALPAQSLGALIQLRGGPLSGGTFSGSVSLVLERAPGGHTTLLTFRSPGGPVRLLLDTGASSSMVTPALAKRLGLSSRILPPEGFELAGGGSDCQSLKPSRVSLPVLELRGQRNDSDASLGSVRLSGAEALLMPVGALPAGVDGVLGAPSLRQLPFRIDPIAERISFGGAALRASANAPPPGVRVPLHWRRGVPLLSLKAGRAPVEALADTGAEGLFISSRLAALLEPMGPAQPLRLVGFCGEQGVRRQRFAGLTLKAESDREAAARGGDLEGIVTENPVFAQLGVEAIVGQELLRHRLQLWHLEQEPPMLLLW